MAKYTSRYEGLGFYVDEQLYRFHAGQFSTDDPKIIAVLDDLPDVTSVDEDVPAEEEAQTEEPAKTARKTAAK